MKTLWSHLVFVNIKARRIGRIIVANRTPVIVYGLFNQLFSLFTAIDLAKILGRNMLFVGNFYVNFNNKNHSVPVSKVIHLHSLSIPTSDWVATRQPQPSHLIKNTINYPADAVRLLRVEDRVVDLEIGCCFSFPLPNHTRQEHIQRLRFHPIFYQLVSSFLQQYPQYQVIHYRMESDFSTFFYKQYNFQTNQECRQYMHQQYQHLLTQHFDPTIHTLVVSHYYKDPHQCRDFDLQWNNLIHFNLKPDQKQLLCRHLQLPLTTPMREVDAIIDFILCTTPNVCKFIGNGGSTFSGSICLFRNNQKCFLVHPIIKMV